MNKKPPKTGPASPETTVDPKAEALDGRRTPAMRNIYRRGDTGASWWQVTIKRGSPKRTYFKTFSDSRYGGEAEALAAAQAWRDETVRLHPTPTPMDGCSASA